MSQRKGGFGLHKPIDCQYASKISTMLGMDNQIIEYYPFLEDTDINNNINNIDSSNDSIYNSYKIGFEKCDILKYRCMYNDCINIFYDNLDFNFNEYNKLVKSSEAINKNSINSHRDLISLMDNSLEAQIKNYGSKYDHARIYALQMNGTQTFQNVPYNTHYSTEFSNQDHHFITSLIFGLKISNKNKLMCKLCNKTMDNYGYHALSCPNGGYMIKRHDALCDKLGEFAKQAGFEVKFEERYRLNSNNEKERIPGRPGDILIHNYTDEYEYKSPTDVYYDITVGNIFSNTYIDNTSKERGWLASKKEELKKNKYLNQNNIQGIGIEVIGGISQSGKRLLHQIADKIFLRTNVAQSVLINQMRSKLVAILHKNNAKMIKEAFADQW